MGRKRRMKSTFINEVREGTLWYCHTKHNVVANGEFRSIEKGYFIVINVENTIFVNHYVANIHSQKDLQLYSIPLEEFFLYYRPITNKTKDIYGNQ
jgi:hypothetical protein